MKWLQKVQQSEQEDLAGGTATAPALAEATEAALLQFNGSIEDMLPSNAWSLRLDQPGMQACARYAAVQAHSVSSNQALSTTAPVFSMEGLPWK